MKPTWGLGDDRSPQWLAGTDLAQSRLGDRLDDQLLSLTRTRPLRPTDPLDRVVAQYVAEAAALGDQVEAVNRLFETIALNQTRMPIDTDPDYNFGPTGSDSASLRAFL